MFALVVGVVAAVSMGTWAAARRGGDAYGRFVRAVDRPAVTLWFCDPTVTKEQAARAGGFCRIAWLPWALAVAVAVLASAALGHALVMSVRSNRRELAVLRSLGFTPRQVRRAAGWEAAVLALAALVLGIPLGLLLGTSGWGVLMRGIGLSDRATVPAIALPLVLAAVVALAVGLSVWPGRRAAPGSARGGAAVGVSLR